MNSDSPPATFPISPASDEAIARAARALRDGDLVAFATETVYGLGANALNASAVARIFAAKGRPATNPLIVHAASTSGAREVVAQWPDAAEVLACAFWPGPLTLVLPRRAEVPDAVTAGLNSVGVRVPNHALAQRLLEAAGVPVAAPSANRSEAVSPTGAAHVQLSLGAFLDPARDMILDGGRCGVGIESSVLDLTHATPVLLRPGGVSQPEIEAAIGPIQLARAPETAGEPHASPGMSARHYAPRARAVRFLSRQALRHATRKYLPTRLGLLLLSAPPLDAVEMAAFETRALPPEPEGYAREFYAALHLLDGAGCEEIWIEMPPDEPRWQAVRDRITRATVEGAAEEEE
jgi:L-threonylcarbamoyladenylate synthase